MLPSFTEQLKQEATRAGFVLGGVTLAAAPRRLQAFHDWLDAGYAGQMAYLEDRRGAYAHPHHVLEGCRSLLMLAFPYAAAEPQSHEVQSQKMLSQEVPSQKMRLQGGKSPRRGKIASYAQGTRDYHDVIQERLKRLRNWILEQRPTAAVRGVVDTAPLLERELAEAAGIGWVGKNTLLLNREWGSYFFLAAVLTDIELQPDSAYEHGYCGTCSACLQACPTEAFPEPFVLDASRCISYLTIEHRQTIDPALQMRLDGWVFGCDVCQQVCPWNHHQRKHGSSSAVDPELLPRDDLAQLDIPALLELSDDEFRTRFRRTPLWRAKRRGVLRNAILVAGTSRLDAAYASLARLCDDAEPLIAQAARWAVRQFEAG